MREIGLIDTDQHILEPPDLWQARVPKRFKDRAPKMAQLEKGDAWIIEGAPDPITFGHNALGGTLGGLTPEGRSEWIRWEQAPKGCYDPDARVAAMDEDGVDVAIVYPTPRISGAIYWNNEDPEFHLACVQAYNDWLSDFCSHAPKRLGGIAMIPTLGIDEAIAELQRATSLPGICSVELKRWPNGDLLIAPEDDRFFAVAHEQGTPINIHVSFGTAPVGAKERGATGDMRHLDAPLRAKQLINEGVFDRYPRLKVAFIETDCGWVPYVKEQMNDRFRRLEPASRPPIQMKPGDYFDRNLYFAFITDSFGVASRHAIGVTQMMWSSDYPHTGTDYPKSWNTIEKHFEGVPEDEKLKILRGNAAQVYGYDKGG
ncbi:amidohydrolase [Dehalococcoidia bacterium]|nr:amidohydrolase [Dehalococcoidia bacterium]